MNRSLRFGAALSALLLTGHVFADEAIGLFGATLNPGDAIPGHYVVMLKRDASVQPEELVRSLKLAHGQIFNRVRGFAAALSSEQLDLLKKDARVETVEPDYVVSAFARASQVLPTGVNRIDAELNPTALINGVDERVDADIAIIDTGVDRYHTDLNVVSQANFSSDLSADDRNGHGSHVAGIAAAKDNGVGVVGVAPGARIWSVKVLDRNGYGSISGIIAGIDYVTAHADAIDVANMSLGCECVSAALNEALDRSIAAGVVYAVAAGNSAKDASTFSPASHPDVITVSAVADFNGLPGGGAPATCYSEQDDTFANFSNYGAGVDIAAPGVCIYSTWKMGRYATISGTSMASPHVAGAAALYIARAGKPTDAAGVAAVRDALVANGFSQGSANGFSGDPDASSEPLLNAQGL